MSMIGALVEFLDEVPYHAAEPGERGLVIREGEETYTAVTTWKFGARQQEVTLHKSREGAAFRVLYPGMSQSTVDALRRMGRAA